MSDGLRKRLVCRVEDRAWNLLWNRVEADVEDLVGNLLWGRTLNLPLAGVWSSVRMAALERAMAEINKG